MSEGRDRRVRLSVVPSDSLPRARGGQVDTKCRSAPGIQPEDRGRRVPTQTDPVPQVMPCPSCLRRRGRAPAAESAARPRPPHAPVEAQGRHGAAVAPANSLAPFVAPVVPEPDPRPLPRRGTPAWRRAVLVQRETARSATTPIRVASCTSPPRALMPDLPGSSAENISVKRDPHPFAVFLLIGLCRICPTHQSARADTPSTTLTVYGYRDPT
jgi:hypothetical protein